MSKTAQRKASRKHLHQQLYQHGKEQALKQKKDPNFCFTYYPKSAAWKAGFLDHGGKKFWGRWHNAKQFVKGLWSGFCYQRGWVYTMTEESHAWRKGFVMGGGDGW